MKLSFRVLAALAFGIPAILRAAIYVSPSGDDANDGAAGRPVRTLERAKAVARAQVAESSVDTIVWLGDGTYRLSSPLRLEAADSGVGGRRVIWAALPGAAPVISGGVQITGWSLVDAARNIWSAPAPSGFLGARQLFIDGVRADRARGRLPVHVKKVPLGYKADSPTMAAWRRPSDLEFVYTGGDPIWTESFVGPEIWAELRIPVADIQGRSIVMAQPAWSLSDRVELPEYVENAFELLGTPGQWYFDSQARTLYYTPRPGEDLAHADVEAPVIEVLLTIAGTWTQPVHDIALRGLQFSYATWLAPSKKGYSGGPGDVPGNVMVRNARGIDFIHDAFTHLGGTGLEFASSTQDCLVQGGIFRDISGNGIEVNGPETDGRPIDGISALAGVNRVADNWFSDVAAEYHGCVGIATKRCDRIQIEHNQIDHVPYAAILIGWNGGGTGPSAPLVTSVPLDAAACVVERNLIIDPMQLLGCGGGICVGRVDGKGTAGGAKIIGNVIEGELGMGHAIFVSGAGSLTVSSNVLFQNNRDDWGGSVRPRPSMFGGPIGGFIRFEGNYWQQGDPDSDVGGTIVAHNRLITAVDQAPRPIFTAAGVEPEYRAILQTRYGSSAVPEPPDRVAALAGSAFALVAWNPPRFEGGAPIRTYTVTASNGRQMTISAGQFRSEGYARVAPLPVGTPCTFTVIASNVNGPSSPSLPSLPVTPTLFKVSKPGPPRNIRIFASGGMASVHMEPPGIGEDGGSAILGYVVTVGPIGRKVIFSGRAALTLGLSPAHGKSPVLIGVIDGLATGRTYTFDVAAINAAGPGANAERIAAAVAP